MIRLTGQKKNPRDERPEKSSGDEQHRLILLPVTCFKLGQVNLFMNFFLFLVILLPFSASRNHYQFRILSAELSISSFTTY